MIELKDIIPVEFYNTGKATKPIPRVDTVGELIKQLKRLPSNLPLSCWPEKHSTELVVYNVSSDNAALGIEEVDL